MKFLFAAVVMGLALAFPHPATAFSMDDILSAPYISHLSASADGHALAWTTHIRGARNLFVAIGGKMEQVTHYSDDDGQEVYDPQFLAGNEGVVYERGDNGGEANPNPLSLVEAPERTIYVTNVSGGAPVSIGTGIYPAPSPTGLTIAWEKNGALQIATLQRSGASYTTGTVRTPYVRGTISSLVWSPDGTRLALVNRRGDHSFVGIYTLSDKQLVYATTDFTYDANPTWSRDSTRVAFTREPGGREGETPYTQPSREPWSIWVADARSGRAKKIWQARRGTGSEFYGVDGRTQLWWLANDRIAFPWEGNGWRNLYSVSASGGAATNLTPGKFETEMVSVAPDGNRLFYAANENAIDERHIWEVRLAGAPQQLTGGPHNQWRPAATASGVAYLDAGYKDPTVVMARDDAQTPPAQVSPQQTPASFPAAQVVQPRLVMFRAADGLLIHGQLFVPKDGHATHAGLIFTHGGSERQMLAGFHYMEAYTTLYESNQYYANHGFVVLSINYRSGIMYGHDFRDAKHVGYRGASEYQDVLAGAAFLKGVPTVDGRRIGLYGLSYGGYLTALGLARNSDIFKAGADFAGVHNWATIFDEGSVHIGTAAERRIALQSSPVGSIARWRSPVFLAQGDDDRNVPFSQGVDLATRLRDRGVDVQTMVFPNETHENLVYAHTVQLYEAAARFLIEHLAR